jgi:hypothetical protein
MNQCLDFFFSSQNAFLRKLAEVVCVADVTNRELLRIAYPAIVEAYYLDSWDKSPVGVFPEIVCSEVSLKKIEKASIETNRGSFNFYRHPASGTYVSRLSQLIILADDNNLALIEKVYPQMVAAFRMENWDNTPEGFWEKRYDSKTL